jgi:hypothetical protein
MRKKYNNHILFICLPSLLVTDIETIFVTIWTEMEEKEREALRYIHIYIYISIDSNVR